jgi:hypothetical protein
MTHKDEKQDKEISEIVRTMNKNVEMGTLVKIIAILVTFMGLMFGWYSTQLAKIEIKADLNKTNISEVSGDIKSIKTDIKWLIQEYRKDPSAFRSRIETIQLSRNGN